MVTAVIVGALLQTDDAGGNTYLKFNGMMVELLACIYPNIYRNYITADEKGCKKIYTELLKTLYGTLDVALLFWVKLTTDLERWGLNMNQYN